MSTGTITLSIQLESPLISNYKAMKRLLAVKVTVPQGEKSTRRLPVNLAMVMDRSGSMNGGKLDFVKQAATHLLDMLGEGDRVAVIAYDDEVQVLSASICLSASQKEKLKKRIRTLQPGGSTALFAGWMNGAEQVAESYLDNGVNRTLLLTDGLANVGESRPKVLAKHAAELQQRGVATSTFGVGADFDQFLLEQMAERGGGQYHFIETPKQIPAMFERELNELMSIEARKAVLKIASPDGVTLRLLGDLPHANEGKQLRIPMGDLCAGREIVYYLEMEAEPLPMGHKLPLQMELTYTTQDGESVRCSAEASFTYALDEEALAAPCDRTLQEKAATLEMAVAETEALRLADAGDFVAGAGYLRRAQAMAAPHLSMGVMDELDSLSSNMAAGVLDPMAVKARHHVAYQRRQSRSEDPEK